MKWDTYLARGVLIDEEISVNTISSAEARLNHLQSKLNSFFKSQGLSPFSAKVAVSFLQINYNMKIVV